MKVTAALREEQIRSAYATLPLAEADERAARVLRQARGRLERGNLAALITARRAAAQRGHRRSARR